MENARSVQPLPGYITLKIIDPETKTASGLEIPDTAQEKPQLGEVLDIGKIPKEELIKQGVENSLEAVKMVAIQLMLKKGIIVAFKKEIFE